MEAVRSANALKAWRTPGRRLGSNTPIRKLERGLQPDVKSVGEGVREARIDYGPGYRVYFASDGSDW
jgi:putative addiction module killer protein